MKKWVGSPAKTQKKIFPWENLSKEITCHCLPQDLLRVRQGKLPKHFDRLCSRTKSGTGWLVHSRSGDDKRQWWWAWIKTRLIVSRERGPSFVQGSFDVRNIVERHGPSLHALAVDPDASISLMLPIINSFSTADPVPLITCQWHTRLIRLVYFSVQTSYVSARPVRQG